MNTFKKIHAAIVAADEKTHLKWLYIIAAICMVLNFIIFKISFVYDTYTYMYSGEVFFSGQIDQIRTPIYPLIIAIARRINEVHFARLIVSLQLVIYFLSLRYLYRLNELYIKNKALLFSASVLFVVLPQFSTWSMCLMTESVALSITIIFSYYVLLFVKTKSAKASIISNLLLVIMLLLRPSFLYVIAVMFIVNAYLFIKKRNSLVNITGLVLMISSLLMYCYAYKLQNGLFTTGEVQYINQFGILEPLHLIDYSTVDKKKLKKFTIVHPDGKHEVDCQIWHSLSISEKSSLINYSLKKNWFAYTGYNLRKIFFISGEPCFEVLVFPRNELYGSLINDVARASCTILMVYVLCLIHFCMMVNQFCRKRFPILNVYLWLIVVGMFVTSIFGSGDDWKRLVLPCTPFLLITIFQLFDKISIKRVENNEFE